MKDKTYLEIKRHLSKRKIKGPYVGLAAAYTPEIFTLLNQNVEYRFVNCQLHRMDYKKLLEYQPFVAKAYSYEIHNVKFELYRTDIIKYLFTQCGEFSIYDLDFMCTLTREKIEHIFAGVVFSVKLPATIAVWHTAGRAVTNKELNEELRPYLVNLMDTVFDVVDYTPVDYYEGFPMRCDILTLEQKKHGRRRTAA